MNPIFDPKFISFDYLFGKILEILKAIYDFFLSSLFYNLMLILSLFFLAVIVYAIWRTYHIKQKEKAALLVTTRAEVPTHKVVNPRWEHVLAHIATDDPHRWQLAIIEADIILDEMTQAMRVPGENLGERLKNIERSDFFTLDLAWEAHKVRNQIAHAGTSYTLTRREAKRIIDLYREVFHEFGYI
ncbi:MAG TPA: hypothetical protein VJ103_01265 [Candidatus Paceibacterota bacterium]|nr:hypothetical protein [Candidatus Paceibacterota bacterium]